MIDIENTSLTLDMLGITNNELDVKQSNSSLINISDIFVEVQTSKPSEVKPIQSKCTVIASITNKNQLLIDEQLLKKYPNFYKLNTNENAKYVCKAFDKVWTMQYNTDANSGKTNGGEVYTPVWTVIDMTNLSAEQIKYDSQSLDPCCGSGNIITYLLALKLIDALDKASTADEIYRNIIISVRTLHAVDINSDSVNLCYNRLIDMINILADVLYNNNKINKVQQIKLVEHIKVDMVYAVVFSNTMMTWPCIANYGENLTDLEHWNVNMEILDLT